MKLWHRLPREVQMGQSVTWLRSELASAELTAGSRVLKTFSSLDNSMSLCSLLALTVLDESEEMNTCVWQAKPGPNVAQTFGS